MTFSKALAIVGIALLAAGCDSATTTYSNPGSDSSSNPGGSGSNPYSAPTGDSSGVSGLTNGSSLSPVSGSNVMQMTVNGSLCLAANSEGYVNKPCVSVTICSPTGADCQTIDDVLLDTGSYGLRVFGSVLSASLVDALTPVTVASGSGGTAEPLAECAQFGDGSADWGPVETAQVGLGSEGRVSVPIQIINSKYVGMSTNCSSAATTGDTPEDAGYNAILGVGLFAQDCGDGCAPGYQGSAQNGMYFACDSTTSTCSGTAVSFADQVTNPVSALSRDNNGVILELPSVELGGESSVNGYVVLGIGTESNNMPDGVTAYPADSDYGEFSTSFSGQTYSESFVDSGSNALYFQPPSNKSSELPDCNDGFLCPSSTVSLTASSSGYNGSPTSQVPFYVGNADNLNGSYNVFSELAGDMDDGGESFDWGLPFFFGRNVYVGIANTSSTLGEGPYWAY